MSDTKSEAGKGDAPRPREWAAWDSGWDRIWGGKAQKPLENKGEKKSEKSSD